MKIIFSLMLILISITGQAQRRSKLRIYKDSAGVVWLYGDNVNIRQVYGAIANHYNLQLVITDDNPSLHNDTWYFHINFDKGLKHEITVLDQIIPITTSIENDSLLVAYKPRPIPCR